MLPVKFPLDFVKVMVRFKISIMFRIPRVQFRMMFNFEFKNKGGHKSDLRQSFSKWWSYLAKNGSNWNYLPPILRKPQKCILSEPNVLIDTVVYINASKIALPRFLEIIQHLPTKMIWKSVSDIFETWKLKIQNCTKCRPIICNA